MRKPVLHSNNQGGQAIILIAMVMVVLVASLGLAIDGGGMFLLYRDVQNATDAAALTASFALCTGDSDNIQAAAAQSASQNGFVNGVDDATVTIENPPTSGPFAGDPQYVTVEIVAEKPAYFIQVVYSGDLRVSARTTSQCVDGQDFGFPPESALVALKNSCNNINDAGVDGRGTSSTVVIGSVFSNISSACKGLRIQGAADWVVTGEICSDGAIDNGATNSPIGSTPAVETRPCDSNVTNLNDPLGLSTNPPQCDRTVDLAPLGQYAGANGPAPAGYYSSFSTSPSQNVVLSSGIYCVDTDIDLKGALSNEAGGVTIYQDCTNCRVSTNAQARNNIQASSSGPYAGLLLYTRSTQKQQNQGIKMNGGANSDITGTVYAPEANCSVEGGDDLFIVAQFICWDYFAAGNSETTIIYEPSAFYTVPPSYGITE
ncbi:MAG: pilus assembly protein TadG-related protein [Anaerolineae bacterium]